VVTGKRSSLSGFSLVCVCAEIGSFFRGMFGFPWMLACQSSLLFKKQG